MIMHLLESVKGKMNPPPQRTVKSPKKQSKFTQLGGTWNENVNSTMMNFPNHYQIIFIHLTHKIYYLHLQFIPYTFKNSDLVLPQSTRVPSVEILIIQISSEVLHPNPVR